MNNNPKYRLKKDTPFYKKGTEFYEDWLHKDVLLNDDCYAVANLNELDNPGEWFEEVEENYLFEELTHYAQGDKVAVEIWFRKDKDGGCPKEMVDFSQFMRAINVVSQDKGFMTRQPDGIGWAIYLRDNGQLDTTSTYNELAGAFCFAWIDEAAASIKKHPDEWKTIAKYKWGK